jgi:pimeloyl-ACP methyl ester carboxylesterase
MMSAHGPERAKPSEAVIANWWRQGMMGGAKAHYDGIVAFSQTDFTEDLKKIIVPVLVMHSEDDQIEPSVLQNLAIAVDDPVGRHLDRGGELSPAPAC